MLTDSDTARIAKQAGLEFTEEELSAMTRYLNQMEEFLAILDEAHTDNVEPMHSPLESEDMHLREDKAQPFPGVDGIMQNAPDVREGHIAVPKVRKHHAEDS